MKNVQLRHRPELPLVINGLDIKIRGGEKLGIVARTGAGKSPVTQALFRIVKLAGGKIYIHGLDISTLPLREMKSRIIIIKQDPTLFKGTICSNLDLFDTYTDLDLYIALRKSGLLDDEKNKIQLNIPVEESGSNFSFGQRQLIALARDLLKDNRIVFGDEATSSVDMETDANVQRVMRDALQARQ